MAYDFDGSNDNIAIGDIAIDGLATLAISVWANVDTLVNYQKLFSKEDGSSLSDVTVLCGGPGVGDNNEFAIAIRNGGTCQAFSNGQDLISTGVWQHWFFYYDGGGVANADKVKGYFNGAAKTLSFGGTFPTTTPTNTSSAQIGAGNGANVVDGKIAELAIWSGLPGGLAHDQAAALLAQGYSPNFLRKNGLHYYPLVRSAIDVWGGNTGTITEAAPSAHPRIINPVNPMIGHNAGAGGGGGGFQAAWARGANTVIGAGARMA
jgi:hypothetical protein